MPCPSLRVGASWVTTHLAPDAVPHEIVDADELVTVPVTLRVINSELAAQVSGEIDVALVHALHTLTPS